MVSFHPSCFLDKKRVYGLVHSGYGIVEDTICNPRGTIIDGQRIRSVPIYEQQKLIGYRPSCGDKFNSDYMSLYIDPFADQIRKWLQNESLIALSPRNPVTKFLGPVQIYKSTIEPKKPR